MILLPTYFLRSIPPSQGYSALPTTPSAHSRPSPNHVLRSNPNSKKQDTLEPGMHYEALPGANSSQSSLDNEYANLEPPSPSKTDHDDNLGSPDGLDDENGTKSENAAHDSLHLDVRGISMAKHLSFYEVYFLIGALTGIGLMTIK